MKLVDLIGLHIEATSGAPLVLLREHDAPHRVLPIFVGGPEAASIAVALSGQASPRPLTHDVMAALVQSLDAHVDAVEVTDLHNGAFLAAISVSGPGGGDRLDTRPSDAIALAVRLGAPLFVSDDVLDEAGAVIPEAPDDEAIDEAVAEFREFLDKLDPASFADTGSAAGDGGDANDDPAAGDDAGAPDPAEDAGTGEPEA
jgi:bifunctional DNase/RNase